MVYFDLATTSANIFLPFPPHRLTRSRPSSCFRPSASIHHTSHASQQLQCMFRPTFKYVLLATSFIHNSLTPMSGFPSSHQSIFSPPQRATLFLALYILTCPTNAFVVCCVSRCRLGRLQAAAPQRLPGYCLFMPFPPPWLTPCTQASLSLTLPLSGVSTSVRPSHCLVRVC